MELDVFFFVLFFCTNTPSKAAEHRPD